MYQIRGRLRTLLALVALVLTSSVMMVPSAYAKEIGHWKVGHLEAWYTPG